MNDVFVFTPDDRIRRAGYPIRHSFEAFVDRYHMLVRGLDGKMRAKHKETAHIIASHAISDKDWQLGHTKVFLKVREKNTQEAK